VNWRSSFSSHPLVNCAWNLIPGLVCWALWKEHNKRIIRGIYTQEEIIIPKIKSEIWEMVTSLPTQTAKAPPTISEVRILSMLDLPQIKVHKVTLLSRHEKQKNICRTPELGPLKLN